MQSKLRLRCKHAAIAQYYRKRIHVLPMRACLAAKEIVSERVPALPQSNLGFASEKVEGMSDFVDSNNAEREAELRYLQLCFRVAEFNKEMERWKGTSVPEEIKLKWLRQIEKFAREMQTCSPEVVQCERDAAAGTIRNWCQ